MDHQQTSEHPGDGIDWKLLHRLPRTAKRVLELGCGNGTLGEEFKHFVPNCHYVGVTGDPEAASQATPRLDRVIQGDLSTLDPATALAREKPFDVLVLNDFLDQTPAPADVLTRWLPFLTRDASVVALASNAGHWRALDGMPGEDGAGQGKRAWILEEAKALLKNCGIEVTKVTSRKAEGPALDQMVAGLAGDLARLNVDQAYFLQHGLTTQFIMIGSRQPQTPLLVQAMTLRPVGAVNDVRIDLPQQTLSTIPGVHTMVDSRTTDLSLGRAFNDKIFLFHRPIMTYAQDLGSLRKLLGLGYLLVAEFDDHPVRWPTIQENNHLTFRGMHAVQTSTDALAKLYRKLNPEVAVFPNAVVRLPDPPARAPAAPVRLFFGALNRQEDWAPIMPALNRVLAAQGDRVSVSVVHDQEFFDALETPHKEFHPLCDYATYQRLLGACDISLMPLLENSFNAMKSDLKFIEAAAHGVVALASPVVYAKAIRNGRTGMIFRSAEDFETQLRELIDDDDRRLHIGAAARDYVRAERMLAYQTAKRLAWYRSLMKRRKQLTLALYRRVPELAP